MIGHHTLARSDLTRQGKASHRERGAVLVEFALVAGVLILLVFGALEFGLAWQVSSDAVGSSRTGARTAASLGKDQTADFYAVTSVKASLESHNRIGAADRIIIYKASSTDGQVPASCLAASPSGICNVYLGSVLASLGSTPGPGWGADGCWTGAAYNGWCPSARNDVQVSADYLGVAVVLNDGSLTGLFPDRSVQRRAVMRIEPK